MIPARRLTPEVRAKFLAPRARVVVLVGTARPHVASGPARDVFTSALFDRAVKLAELAGDATFAVTWNAPILSLEGFVSRRDVAPFPPRVPLDWGRAVLREVEAKTLGAPRLRVVLLMGAPLAKPILTAIREAQRTRTTYEAPSDLLAGLRTGARIEFLDRSIREARDLRRVQA